MFVLTNDLCWSIFFLGGAGDHEDGVGVLHQIACLMVCFHGECV